MAISDQTTNLDNLVISRNLSTGTFTATGTLAGGASTLSSTLSVAGATNLDSTLSVGGATTVTGALTQVGAATLSSTLSVGGAATLTGALTQVGAATLSSTLSVGGNTTLTGTMSLGGNAAITKLATGTVSVVTMTVTGAASVTTTAAISGLSTVDRIFVGIPTSGLSGDLTLDAWPSAADTVTLQFSTTSSAGAVQAGPVSYPYLIVR